MSDWTIETIKKMISNKVEENLFLDYKSGDSLSKTDEKKKKEISKDISAMANSAGGKIIYGIAEYKQKDKKHLPQKISSVNGNEITKEWLEQIINSTIKPRITGIKIFPVRIPRSRNNQTIYIVEIPQSSTAHQASDFRYYKRFNFASVPMDDYEVKDIINRNSRPNLEIILYQNKLELSGNLLSFPVGVGNKSLKVAKEVQLFITFENDKIKYIRPFGGFNDASLINDGKRIFHNSQDVRVFFGVDAIVGNFEIQLEEGVKEISFVSKIIADNLIPEDQKITILINDGKPQFVI